MKILSFEVVDLFDKEGVISLEFNEDLNILTGRNGSGKTSVLKLIWYVMSGNILMALREVKFKRITLVTTEYECTVIRLGKLTCRVELKIGEDSYAFDDEKDSDGDSDYFAEDAANARLIEIGGSLFLPTFRRIEGGFGIVLNSSSLARINTAKSEVEDSLTSLSRKLSNRSHVFVSSISTVDVVGLVLREYSNLSELNSEAQQETSSDIISTIKAFKREVADISEMAATTLLDEIKNRIEELERQREKVMKPIDAVRVLVAKLFQHGGIKISNRLSFGDAAGAISSDALSAGEKQMLSFICYNAFTSNSVIFIDEPELSLHVDWQRQLFPILQNQESSNQFIIATHSPFIYSKYPDKEILIDPDRGFSEEQ